MCLQHSFRMLTTIEKETNFLMQALKNALVGVWHIDWELEKFHISDSMSETLGLNTCSMTKVSERNWFESSNEVLQPLINTIKNQIEISPDGSFFTRFWMMTADGRKIFTRVTGKVTETDQKSKPLQAAGTFYDFTAMYESQRNLEYRYEIERMVSGISADFIGSRFEKLDDTINRSLRKIGDFCSIDRSYLFLINSEEDTMSNTHEWCAPNIKPEIDNLQNVPCAVFGWWMSQLNQGTYIYVKKVEEMPEEASAERDVLLEQHIKSLLVVPMFSNRRLIGFIGFDSVNDYKEWDEFDIELLTTIANTFTNAIEAKQNNDLLIREKEKAIESNRLKSAFLATVNHELRTPLHHILGFSDLIRSMDPDKKQTETYASKIFESGKNLLQIVEDILSLATGNASEVKVREELVQGADLFVQHKAYMSEILANVNREKDIKLKLYPAGDFLNTRFNVDKNKLNQVVVNLFKNAVKFTRRGTISYDIALVKNQLTLTIEDDGVGIPAQQRELIFDYFRQGDDKSTRRFQGIGIGLSICKNLVQIMNGNISVESEIGKGSKFTVSVPITDSDTNAKATGNTDFFLIPDFSQYRFLIVDEDPTSTLLLKDLLSPTQANILTTGTDSETMAYIGKGCFVDIILVDIHASAERSLKLISDIHQHCQKCSIIGLSAHSLIDERDRALQAGCLQLVSKPIEPQLLFEAIKKGLNPKRKLQKAKSKS